MSGRAYDGMSFPSIRDEVQPDQPAPSGWVRDPKTGVMRYEGDLDRDYARDLVQDGVMKPVEAGLRRQTRPIRTGPRVQLDVDEARRLYVDEGVSLVEIAKRLGANKATVSARLRDAGVPIRNRGQGVKPCGTWAAYKRHLRNQERPCAKCRLAAQERRTAQRDDDYAMEEAA